MRQARQSIDRRLLSTHRNNLDTRNRGAEKIIDSLDIFKQSVPSFNLRGKSHVASYTGALTSGVIFFIMFVYSSVKLDHLLRRANPNISSFL